MKVYLLVMLIAAAVTYLTTPMARWLAIRTGAVTAVRDRDVHTVPTPRLGGVAMLLGLAVALLFGAHTPFLSRVFADSNAARGILAGAAVACALGAADDIWDLDWVTKLIGQVLAAGIMASQDVQLVTIPIFGRTVTSFRLSLFVTVLLVVIAMNAVNFVDGLDGLAAGVIAIGGAAFFIYTYLLARNASLGDDNSSLATLVIAALVGVCVGFLPHNYHPARIFMGDSGAMLIGLVMAGATIVVTGQIDPTVVSDRQALPAFLPIVLPAAVMLLPLMDMTLAVVRRLRAGHSPFHADRMHLHHRLLALGHSHRRAVAIMYVWTAVFAFGAAALVVVSTATAVALLAAGVLAAALLTVGPLRHRGSQSAEPKGA